MCCSVKNKKILFIIFISILILNVHPNSVFGSSFSEKIDPSNQCYPVYNLMDLALNNKTNGNISAQVLVFNATTDNWEVNFALLEMIQNDLQPVVESIYNLDEIYLYSINRSFLPGEIYFLLNTEINNSENAIQSLFSFISLNNETFWYVQNVSFPVFDISAMAIGENLMYNAISLMEIYTGHAVYSDNETNYVCRELDGLIASPWIQNDSSWIKNTPFRELVTNDLTCFVDRIMEIESFNVSFDDSINFDIVVSRPFIAYGLSLLYNQDSDRNQQFKNYFILCSMLIRLWYVESINHGVRESPFDSSWQFSTLIFAFVILLVFKSSRRKVNHPNNDKYVVRRKIL
ncbi:MAG: hypothetical protein KAS95_03730 [Candidatus Heimdallarchaeota archaeon]|nr:hypothetical protein [Candidatus Heimdallarchaeota archaeon]